MSATPEAVAAEAAAAAAATPPDSAAEPTPPASTKTPADLARDAIYARAAAARAAQGDESTQAMAAGVRQMNGEDEGVPIVTTPPVAPSAVPPVGAAATPPLANSQEMVTIHVEGRAIAVPAADVLRHGVAALQKESTADVRLQRATMAERAIAASAAALEVRAAEIERLRATTPTGAAPASTDGNLPPGGQPQVGTTKKALDALLDSDAETAAKALDQVIAERVKAGFDAARAATGGAPPTPTPTGESAIPSPWSPKDIEHANQLFAVGFADVTQNPTVMAQAIARMQQEMASPINRMAKVDLLELAAKVGTELRTIYHRAPAPPNPAPPPPASNSADELAARRTLAARVPGVPTPAAPRSVGPPTEARPPSRAEVVANMRKSRGQA